jgi:glutathione peroxidase
MTTLYDFTLADLDGQPLPLSRYRGCAVLLVNVASRCGLTPQYAGLETLWREGRELGLVVVGLPCNQFGAQEPGSADEIREFCAINYSVSFPLSAKIDVNGPDRHPLYRWLAGPTARFPGDIEWNFEKFLIDAEGEPVERFAPTVKPEDIVLREAIARAVPGVSLL